MAKWSNEASEYLNGYLKQVSVLVRAQGDDSADVVSGLRDHIANEVEADGAATVTIDRLLQVLSALGTPEDVASLDPIPATSTPASESIAAPLPPPAVPPRVTKSVVVHRSPANCACAIILAWGAALVGLAVLGMVAAITLPALSRAREAARRAECQANLKVLGTSLISIATVEGDLPPIDLKYSGIMFNIDLIFPEITDDFHAFVCPSGPNAGLDARDVNDEYGFVFDYLYITHVVTNEEEAIGYLQAVAAAKESGIPLGEEIVMADGTILPRIQHSGQNGIPDAIIPLLVERAENHTLDGYSVLYLDGHVEFCRTGGEQPFPATMLFHDGMPILDGAASAVH